MDTTGGLYDVVVKTGGLEVVDVITRVVYVEVVKTHVADVVVWK